MYNVHMNVQQKKNVVNKLLIFITKRHDVTVREHLFLVAHL